MNIPENTPKKDLETREDIGWLVDTFYEQVRADEQLGPIFNQIITDWPTHLEKITLFWDQVLFNTRLYDGNPMKAHIEVDKKVDYSIDPTHFGTWLFYWINIINENFAGPRADLLKDRARKMQTSLYLQIFKNKPGNNFS